MIQATLKGTWHESFAFPGSFYQGILIKSLLHSTGSLSRWVCIFKGTKKKKKQGREVFYKKVFKCQKSSKTAVSFAVFKSRSTIVSTTYVIWMMYHYILDV